MSSMIKQDETAMRFAQQPFFCQFRCTQGLVVSLGDAGFHSDIFGQLEHFPRFQPLPSRFLHKNKCVFEKKKKKREGGIVDPSTVS